MTPDPSLLAQLRQLHNAIPPHASISTNLIRRKLTAILEAQPPETPLADELDRLRAENARLRVPPPGWHRMAVVRATLPGEPLDLGYYVWVRPPGPTPEEPIMNVLSPAMEQWIRAHQDEVRQMITPETSQVPRCHGKRDSILRNGPHAFQCNLPIGHAGLHRIDFSEHVPVFFADEAPTPDPPAETPTPLVVEPPVDDPEYRAAWNAGYTEAIEDFKAQREAERPAETPTPVDEAVEAVADGTADFSWMPPSETQPRKLSDDAFGLSEHLIITPKPRPAETPTGLAPLEDSYFGALKQVRLLKGTDIGFSAWWDRQSHALQERLRLALSVELLGAQRQASASARREAIEECAAGARRTADEVDSRVEMAPKTAKELSTFGADTLREFAKSLDQLARVSPRPPSGGEQ